MPFTRKKTIRQSQQFPQATAFAHVAVFAILLLIGSFRCSAQGSISISSPTANGTYTGTQTFNGLVYVTCPNCALTHVGISIDGTSFGNAALSSGNWSITLNMSSLSEGAHTLSVSAYFSTGTNVTVSRIFYTPASAIGIDSPASSGSYLGSAAFGGWAVDSAAAIAIVNLSIDGTNVGNASYGGNRQDVCNNYKNYPGCPNVGWNAIVNTAKFTGGSHTLLVGITTADGRRSSQTRAFTIRQAVTSYSIDTPSGSGPALLGQQHFGGWAVDNAFPISSVAISIDGASYGNASYGGNRQDACNAVGNGPGCPYVGWDILVDTAKLAGGNHSLGMTVTTSDGRQTSSSRAFSVQQDYVRAVIDTPQANATYVRSATFSGWAIDDSFAISSVSLSIDGQNFGQASYGQSRADVCNIYPGRSGCPNVGWSAAVDLTRIAAGSHTLTITVTTGDGRSGTLSQSFATQAPGTNLNIDLPAAQQTLSGQQSVSGWAYSNYTAVSSINVSIDGVAFGNAVYGAPRPDVCTAGQYPTCPNVGWSLPLNTVTLMNKAHTLTVSAVTADGQVTTRSVTFTTSNNNSTLLNIGFPQPNSIVAGIVTFFGWAVDPVSTIRQVTVMIDSNVYPSNLYGQSRTDVCAQFPNSPGCPNVGWSGNFETSDLTKAPHTLTVTAVTNDLIPRTTTKTVIFNVGDPGAVTLSREYLYVDGKLVVIENAH